MMLKRKVAVPSSRSNLRKSRKHADQEIISSSSAIATPPLNLAAAAAESRPAAVTAATHAAAAAMQVERLRQQQQHHHQQERNAPLLNVPEKVGEGSAKIFKTSDEEFRLREIYGDGNCMFRAISFILWGTESRHRYLRSLVVNHIEDAWPELKPFVLAEWNMSNLADYIDFMGADGSFASELECLVATKLNRLNLAIYRRVDANGNLRRIIHSQFNGAEDDNDSAAAATTTATTATIQTANLLFSGRNEYGHYDVLLPQKKEIVANS